MTALLCLALWGLSGCVGASTPPSTPAPTPASTTPAPAPDEVDRDGCGATVGDFSARTDPADPAGHRDAIRLETIDDDYVLTVAHRMGIDGVRLVRTSGNWPAQIPVRFDGFTGLEGLNATARDRTGATILAADRSKLSVTGAIDIVQPADGSVELVIRVPYAAVVPTTLLGADVCDVHIGWIDWYR